MVLAQKQIYRSMEQESARSKRRVEDMEKECYDGGRDGLKERGGDWIKGTYNNSFFFLLIYLFMGCVLGLHCCVRAFSRCSGRGLLLSVVRGLLIAVASLVAQHGL